MNEDGPPSWCGVVEDSQDGTSDTKPSKSQTVLQALYDKYGCVCDEPFEFKICVATSAPGITDSGKLVVPSVIGLNYLDIDSTGEQEELSNICQKVTELDLSHNNLCDWNEVVSLLQALPRLHFLNLSYNPFQQSCDIMDSQLSCLPDDLPLLKLVLNGTHISWTSLWPLVEKLKRLEELHLCLNGITHIVAPSEGLTFPKVKNLYLNDNSICEIQDLLTIGHIFPGLQNLVMIDNPLECIQMEPGVSHETFPNLQQLNFSSCKLNDWQVLETLRYFPQLQGLRILRIPLTKKYNKKLCRQLTIGYLPNILSLNGTPVEAAEREDAERAFIRHYMSEENRPSRYEELHQVYGDLCPLADVVLDADQTVNVTITFDGKTELNKLPYQWTLAKLKKHLGNTLVHQPPCDIVIYHEDIGGPFGPERMRFPNRTLLRYRVKDGDVLTVEVKEKSN